MLGTESLSLLPLILTRTLTQVTNHVYLMRKLRNGRGQYSPWKKMNLRMGPFGTEGRGTWGRQRGQLGHRQAWGRKERSQERSGLHQEGHRPLDTPSSGPTPAQRAPGLSALPSPRGQQDPKAVKGERQKTWETEAVPPSGTLRGEALASQSWAAFSPPLPLCPLWRIPASVSLWLGWNIHCLFPPPGLTCLSTHSHIYVTWSAQSFAFCFSHVTHHRKDFCHVSA